MSGPTMVIVTGEPLTILAAAAAIRAARAYQTAQDRAQKLEQGFQSAREANQGRQSEARQAGLAAMAADRAAAESRLHHMQSLAREAGISGELTLPTAPAVGESRAESAYVAQLQALADALEAALREHLPAGDERQARLEDLAGPAQVALAQQLAAYAQRQSAELLHTVQRLLARVAYLGELPPSLRELVAQLQTPLSRERAEALLLELRLRVQQVQQAALAQAQALVLEQSLLDLGYQVEEVGQTLFVEGGVVHFRRPGWGAHMVRLRLDPKRQMANFNVIRAVAAGENEQSVLDHLAEDRWCAEFPALLQALAERGLKLDVTRRLQAGELPVQLVAADKLPRFADEEERAVTVLRQKSLGACRT